MIQECFLCLSRMSKYSLFDCPRILVTFVIYEYNYMIARPFVFVVYVDVPCLFLCSCVVI